MSPGDGAAAAGTMLLEFARLSRLTGDRRYAQKARGPSTRSGGEDRRART